MQNLDRGDVGAGEEVGGAVCKGNIHQGQQDGQASSGEMVKWCNGARVKRCNGAMFHWWVVWADLELSWWKNWSLDPGLEISTWWF